ncbi:hypothetical protein PMAYCL1PPCAC_20854, partial [Pristionchus mayeri]
MECLICCEPIRHARLGVNACRACAAFYKRNSISKIPLKCKGGKRTCSERNRKTNCRLCRFMRFREIMEKAVGNSNAETEESTSTEDIVSLKQGRISSFINHESFYDAEPSTSTTPLMYRLRKGYSLMCLIRYSGELAKRTITDPENEIHVSGLVLVPAKYSTYMEHENLRKQAMKAFASLAFEDFRHLDEESKDFIIKTSHDVMNALDASYRTAHHFPEDANVRSPGYTTYLRGVQDLDRFFADCTDDVDKETVISELERRFDRSLNKCRKYYKKVKPTDVEFVALLGLSVWNDEIANINEKMLQLSMRNRSMIMKEMHVYYSEQGNFEYAYRIGQLFCALVNFQNNKLKLDEEFHLYRLMNMFNDYYDK